MDIFSELPVVTILIRIGTAIVTLIIGHRLATLSRNGVRKALNRAKLTSSLISLFTLITYYSVILLAAILALSILGVPMGTIVAAVGIILIILGIALQESLANFAATILFLLFQPYQEGELIETAGIMGTVKEIQLFHSVVITFQNKTVTIPNGKVQDSNIINYSRLGILRADVKLSVSYDDNLPKVKQILQDILASDERILAEPEPSVAILDFGDNGIEIGVRPYVKVADYWHIQSDLRERIKEAFDASGITIPFPQRDIHMVTATS